MAGESTEAIVCFVERWSQCWVYETFEVHTTFRDKAFQNFTKEKYCSVMKALSALSMKPSKMIRHFTPKKA